MASLRHRTGDYIQNRYEVRKLLGSGAFGTVYGCRDTELDIAVAVKELHVLDNREGSAERETALKQFRAEAIHLSRLRHPHIVSGHYEPYSGSWNICPVCGLDYPNRHSCPDHGGQLLPVATRHYLVMEYIGGPDLLQAAYQAGGKLPVDDVVRIARDIAAALAHIHSKGYVHRDIKPENIRLRRESHGESGEAVLLDFGITTEGQGTVGDKYGTRVRRHTHGGGTVGYAPESPSERREPDARSDIHAFGMTIYHLLTACDPTDPDHLKEMRRYSPIEYLPEMPVGLNDFIVAAIDPDPEQRPQDGSEALAWLRDLYREDEPEEEDEDILQPVASEPGALVPFLFRNGSYARDIGELVGLLDQFPAEGARYLSNGELERWIFSFGDTELAESARDLRQRFRSRPAQALEMWLQASGWVELPGLEVDPDLLNFGYIAPEGRRTMDLYIGNPGRGHLFGKLVSSHPAVVTTGEWDGNTSRIAVTFDAHRLLPGPYSGDITLHSSAGVFTVPFQAKVAGRPWTIPFWTVVADGLGGMLAGGLLRSLPFYLTARKPGWGWLDLQTEIPFFPVAALFGLTLGCIWLLWMGFEGIVRRSCSLIMFGGFTAFLMAILGGIFAPSILTNGDLYLEPLFGAHLHNFAAAAWMTAGAFAGATLGTLRRVSDIFSERAFAILIAWAAVFLFLALAIIGAMTTH